MAIFETIFTKLSTAGSATAALVGAGEACRVYPDMAPPNAPRPYIVYSEIAAPGEPTHNEPVGNKHRLIQFSCFGETAAQARGAREAIVSDLDGVTLDNGDNGTLQDDERSGYEEAVDLYRADADLLF